MRSIFCGIVGWLKRVELLFSPNLLLSFSSCREERLFMMMPWDWILKMKMFNEDETATIILIWWVWTCRNTWMVKKFALDLSMGVEQIV